MKKVSTLIIITVLCVINLYGQDLNGYKYVYVPTLTYGDGSRTDIWSISSKLRTAFSEKGFIVISESSSIIEEITNNRCLLLSCTIDHTYVVYGTNKVTISLKNCEDQVVYNNTGAAKGFSVQDDFNKATRRAFDGIKKMSYRFDLGSTPKIEHPEVEATSETEETIKSYFKENALSTLEGIYKSYQNESRSYYKLGIKKRNDKYIAIILEAAQSSPWKEGEIKAIFEQTSMKDFYSCKWYMGDKTSVETFAMMENAGLLSIEYKILKQVRKQPLSI
jgi:hypothetical protein